MFALFNILLLTAAGGTASADWTPPVTVTEGGTQYSFGQDVSVDGTGTVVWSGPEAGGGYGVFARDVEVDGAMGAKRTLSSPPPGAVFATAYAPAIRYDGSGTGTVIWMESAYNSDSCFSGGGSGPESEVDCVVDEYVKARQIGPTGMLSAITVVHHRQVTYPSDGSFGSSSPAYVTYGQPALVGGPGNTLTAVWTESTFAAGCAAYGYSSSYSDSECEADTSVEWVRLSAAAAPLGSRQPAYTTHTTGYGSGHPLMRLRAGAAADGTATVLFGVRRPTGEASCFGGESSIGFLRISTAGAASAAAQLDSGCGATIPDLAVDPGGTAVAVWGWAGTYSADEGLYSRIGAGGSAESPQALLSAGEGDHVSGLDVTRGASGSTIAVWSVEGTIRSRKIPVSGAPGAIGTVAAPGVGHYLTGPRIAAASDGSALVAWEDAAGDGEGLRAAKLAPDGTAGSPHILLANNRRDHGSRLSAGPEGGFMVSWRVSVPHHNRIQAARLNAGTAKANDAFADSRALDPELPDFTSGSNVGATKQAGEPNHAGATGGHSVWYSWTPAAGGPVTLSTCAADGLNPVLAVYTGSSLGALTPVAAAKAGAPSPCAEGDSGVRFDAVAGTTYWIAVDGEGGSVGSFGLKLLARENQPANDAFANARTIAGGLPRSLVANTVDASREPAEPEHGGNPGGASVWFSWTPSRTATAVISACGFTQARPLLGVYTGSSLAALSAVAPSPGGSTDCSASGAAIRFDAVAGTTYRIAVDGKDGVEGRFSLRLAQRPVNDDFAQAETLNGLSSTVGGATNAATKEAGEPNHAGDPGGASVWYSWTPNSSGTVYVSACLSAGKGQHPLLGVYTGSDVAHLTAIVADAGGGSTTGCFSGSSEVHFDYKAGTTYRIAVDGPGGIEAGFSLQVESLPANDDFGAAQELPPTFSGSLFANNRHATKQAGEPNHAGDPGGHSLWYSWTPATEGTAVVSACASFNASPLLAVYTGPDLTHLTPIASAQGGGGNCFPASSKVEFGAAPGTRYYIAVDTPSTAVASSFSLTLNLESVPANDEFANPVDLGGGATSRSGSNRRATKQAGEPNHAGDPGGHSVWYSWTPSSSGNFGISVCDFGSFDSVLAVYTGSSLAALSPVASNDDVAGGGQCSTRDSEVRIAAVAGTTYRIAVDGKAGSTGSFELGVIATPVNDDFAAATSLSGSLPRSSYSSNRLATKQAGEPNHAGDPGGASVWYSWTAPSSGTVKASVCNFGAFDSVLAVYTGSSLAALSSVASNDDSVGGECSKRDSAVSIAAVAGTTYLFAIDGHGGSTGSFNFVLRGRPANDEFDAASALGAFLPQTSFGDNRLATKQAGEPNHAGDPGGHSVWYSWTPNASGTVKVSTCSSAFDGLDPALAVYTGAAVGSLTEIAADKDTHRAGCADEDASVQFAAVAGTAYRIAVDGEGGGEGTFQLELRAVGPINDDFEAAIDLPQEPGLVAGTTVAAGRQPGEPAVAEQTVWYRMLATHDGTVRLHTCSETGEPMDVRVYTGGSLASLAPVADPAGTSAECWLPPRTSISGRGAPATSFKAVAGTVYWIAVDRHFQTSPRFEALPAGPFVLVVEPPANDMRGSAEWVPVSGGDLSRSNVGATREADEEPHAGNPGGHSVWFRWFARASGQATVDTCGSSIDTLLSLEDQLGELESSDDSGTCGAGSTASQIDFEAEEGNYYMLAVDGKSGAQGGFALHVHLNAPDTTPPDTHAGFPAAINSTTLAAFAAPDEPESRFECALDGSAFAPCETIDRSTYSFNFELRVPGLSEGPHTLAVREVDVAGNADPTPAGGSFVVDLVPPQTVLTKGPEGLTRLLGPFEFASNEPGYFECALDEGSFSYCSTPYTAPSIADGVHTLKVRAVDDAGNRDATPSTRSFNLDRTPPVLTIGQGPEGTVETGNVSFAFTASETSTLQCVLDQGALAGCVSPRSYSNLGDGEHTFAVRGIDPAGNVGQFAEREFRAETRPPQTTIDSGPAARVNSGTAEFEFGADEDVSGFECALDGGAFSSCPASHEVTGLGEGSHTILVRATDLAGKQDPTPAERTWVVDTDPPETAIASGPTGTANKHGPFGLSADEAVGYFECALDDGEFLLCSTPYSFGPAADGEHTVRARAVDLAGNVDPTPATRNITLDQTAPTVEILSGPPPVTGSSVSVTFSVSEASASAECRADGESRFFACASPIEFSGFPDGPHTILIRATDTVGNVGIAKQVSFTVDEQPPETTIDKAPIFAGAKATFFFSGSADATEYECAVDELDFATCASPHLVEGLEEGPHEFRVRAIDGAGNIDPTPAGAQFTVDLTPPQTTITKQPGAPVHVTANPFEFESSEEDGGFECALDEADFGNCQGFTLARVPGPHVFAVRAVDRAGNPDPSPATAPFEIVDAGPQAALALSPESGPAPLTVSADAGGSDPDGDALGYELQWGDGATAEGQAPESSLTHKYAEPGLYLVQLEVDDGYGITDSTSRLISVGAPEPVSARAGDDLTAVAGEPIVLDATGSRPLDGIESYEWAVGDGASSGAARFTHTFEQPGDYEAQLTVSGPGGTDTDAATIHVVAPAPAPTVFVHEGSNPLPDAQVVVFLPDGRRVEGRTNGAGSARLPDLPDGAYKVYVYKLGYVPTTGDLDVSGGIGDGDVALTPGAAAEISVTSHRMTLSEIEAAGIDTKDPANQHVYEFRINGKLGGYANSSGFTGGGGCSLRVCHHDGVTTVWGWSGQAGAPILTSFEIPARATFLKEFFDLEVTVTNLATPGITLQHGHASIGIPEGMSLAPTATPQTYTRSVPDIGGGSSRVLHWFLRGDREGEYDVDVSYAASLEPFGESISLSGRTAEPIKVWGASALHLEVDLDDEARPGYPYTAFVKLENVADVPVYNPLIEFQRVGHTGYIEQPRQRHSFGVRELAPGATLSAGPFVFVPEEGGALELQSSLVRKVAGDVDLGGTVVTHPRQPSFETTPELSGRWRNDHDLILDWKAVPGATGYEIYSTPDRKTEFGASRVVPKSELGATKAMVSADRDHPPLFAISSIVGGERKMVHPLLDGATAPLAEFPSIKIEDESRCGGEKTYARVTLEDPDFPLTGFSYARNAGSLPPPAPLNANVYMERIEVPRPGAGTRSRITVTATNSNPADGTVKREADLGDCYYVGLGDSFSSGEGALKGGETFEDSNGCHRSPDAYAQVIRRTREEMVFFDFKACSGAKTQALFHTNEDHHDEEEQAKWASGAGLVTLSIGGNDLGFVPVLKGCIASYVLQARLPLPAPCKIVAGPIVESKLDQLENTLPGELEKLHKLMAENGRLILVGYPQIFPATKPFPANLPCQLIHPSDISWMHSTVTQANQALLRIANRAGVEFVDPNADGAFDGRDVCEFGSFFNGVRPLELVESFHPNEFGQEAMARAVERRINGEPTRVRVEQGKTITQSILVETANELRAHILWPGSDVELSLESPSGEVIDRGHVPAGVRHDLEATSESYLVPDPETGEWKLKAKGLEVDEGGEPVSIEVSQSEPPTDPPLALFEYAVTEGTAPLKVDFDASASFDPSDQPLAYDWEFGDGSTGTGVKPSHTYAGAGEYATKLTVTDEDGETDTFESPPIVVKAELPPDSPDPPDTGGGSNPSPAAAGLAPAPPRLAQPKAGKCKKGFRKKKVHGKSKCVRVKKRRKKGRK